MAAWRALRILISAVVGVGLLGAPAAHAQRFERGASRAQAAPFAPDRPYYRGRGQDPYAVPRGYSGTIGASTPNESGNLGGPSTGGGGGGGR